MDERSLFLAALEKSPADRAVFLTEACGADVYLRGQIEALLRAHEKAAGFLEGRQSGDAATIDQPSWAEPSDRRIGPYKLLQQIGEGGMGTVWMARQSQPVRRTVALKIIKPGMDSAQVVARFEAERQALAMMDHPNIAKVLDAGTTDFGRPYFVMELVKGVPITQYCDQQRLAPRERLALMIPVCQAIQHAHQKGIIHRDIKPSNVLVAAYDGRPVPKVIDFGVAKAMGQQLTERTLFTGLGGLVGTLEYMSPEQAEFNALDVDTRSDVYSLGVLLYELLTGTTPLTKDQLRTAAITELLRVIREQEPPRPSTRISESKDSLASVSAQRRTEPARLPKIVRGELDWIVMKALEKDRARRYETASALVRDVERYLADEAVEACPPSLTYRLQKLVRRHKARTGLLAASIVALLAFVGLGVALAYQARLRIANHNLENEKHLLGIAKGKLEEANDKLTGSNQQLSAAKGELEKTNKQLSNAKDQIDRANDKLAHNAYVDRLLLAQNEFDAGNAPVGQQLLDECEAKYRGWEWRHLHLKFHQHELVTIRANSNDSILSGVGFLGAAERLAYANDLWTLYGEHWTFSPDGRWRASPAMRLVNARDGQKLAVFEGHAKSVLHLAFSPDGQRLATAGEDGTVNLWDLRLHRTDFPHAGPRPEFVWGSHNHGQRFSFRQEFQGGSVSARLIAVAPAPLSRMTVFINDTQVAEGMSRDPIVVPGVSGDHQIVTHLVATADVQKYLRNDKNVVRVQVFNDAPGIGMVALKIELKMSDGSTRYVVSDKSWQAAKLAEEKNQGSETWSPVAESRVDQSLQQEVFVPKIAPLATLEGHQKQVYHVAFSPDGQRLASASGDGTVRLWDVREAKLLDVLQVHSAGVHYVAFSPDGERLASSSQYRERCVYLWDAHEAKLLATLPTFIAPVFSPDGRRLVAGGLDKTVRLWDARDGKPLAVLEGHAEPVSHVAFSPDGLCIASASSDKTVRLWSALDGAPLFTLRGHTGSVSRVAFSPDGQRLSSISNDRLDGTVREWDLSEGNAVATLHGHQGPVTRMIFSSDGQLLASAGDDKTVRLWDARQGKPRETLAGHTEPVRHLAFSPTSQQLGSASSDSTARLWNATEGKLVAILEGHKGAVNQILFSPNGQIIATAGDDTTIRLWDRDGRRQATIEKRTTLSPFSTRGHHKPILALAFASDGARLASSGNDSTTRLWDVGLAAGPPTEWIWGGVAATKDRYMFRKEFEGGSVSATLIAACDDLMEVFLNDVRIAKCANWQSPIKVEVQQHLRAGKNVFIVRAANDAGAAGLALKLVLKTADGNVRYVVTDKSWQATKPGADEYLSGQVWSDVTTLGAMGVAPWEDVFTTNVVGVATLLSADATQLMFTKNGDRLLSATRSKACLWDVRDVKNDAAGANVAFLATGAIGSPMLASFPDLYGDIHFAMSPDEHQMATGDGDGTVRLWDLIILPQSESLPLLPGSAPGAKPLAILRGHIGAVHQVAFSPDGRIVASAGQDGTVRLWDARGRKPLATLRGHTGAVTQVAFNTDGTSIASASADGTLRLWFSEDTPERRAYRQQLWREKQAEQAEAAGEWFAGAFHLGEMLNQEPDNKLLEARWDKAIAELTKTDKKLAERAVAKRGKDTATSRRIRASESSPHE